MQMFRKDNVARTARTARQAERLMRDGYREITPTQTANQGGDGGRGTAKKSVPSVASTRRRKKVTPNETNNRI